MQLNSLRESIELPEQYLDATQCVSLFQWSTTQNHWVKTIYGDQLAICPPWLCAFLWYMGSDCEQESLTKPCMQLTWRSRGWEIEANQMHRDICFFNDPGILQISHLKIFASSSAFQLFDLNHPLAPPYTSFVA